LHLAAGAELPFALQALLEHLAAARPNVNPSLVEDKNGHTALFWAARLGRCANARLLLRCELATRERARSKFGPAMDAPDRWGRRPLHWAVVNGHAEM
jgi:ankyrin repeat protein